MTSPDIRRLPGAVFVPCEPVPIGAPVAKSLLDLAADDHPSDAVEMTKNEGLEPQSVIRAVEPAAGEPTLDVPEGGSNHVRWVGLRLGNIGEKARQQKLQRKYLRHKLRHIVVGLLIRIHLRQSPSADDLYAAYHKWALDDGPRQPGNDGGLWRAIVAAGASIWGRVERAPIWAFRLRHWLVRLAALAFCAGAFWLVAFLVFGKATAFWVAAFAATGLFPAVLGIRWRDRQAEARHGAVHHGADRAHHP